MTKNEPCIKCEYLGELFEQASKTNRNYWLMTELFVMLHDGKDYCEEAKKTTDKTG